MTAHIQKFEFLHGAVLAKLFRSDREYTIRLVETAADWSRATYKINDEVVHVKGSMTCRTNRKDNSQVWSFTFTPDELRSIREDRRHVVVVCGHPRIEIKGEDRSWTVLIPAEQIADLLDLSGNQTDSLSAKYIPGSRKMRIKGNAEKEVLITLSALSNWQILE